MTITPIHCPDTDCPWAAFGVPTRYTEARSWHLAVHRAEEHGEPLTAEQIAYATRVGHALPSLPTPTALPMPVGDQPQPLDDTRLAEIAERVEALNGHGLPGGGWTSSPSNDKSVMPPEMAHVVEDVLRTGSAVLRSSVGVFGEKAHAEFAAHAREDVPALLAEVQRLSERVAFLDAERRRWVDVHDLVERAIDKGWSVIDTCDLEAELGPAPTTDRAEETA